MNPAERIQIITNISLCLQAEYNTTEINIFLGGYNIDTENVSIVNSKRSYVIDLLKSQPNELIIQIANDLGLQTPKQMKMQVNNKKPMELGYEKIFISHSSLDIPVVEKVIDLLEAIGVPSNKIFCSSFEGYGIKLGSDFLEVIKNQLDNNVLVLFILSSNFYSSVISLCEMGATWLKTNKHIPILIPPFEYHDIKGVIPTTQGMKINEKDKLNSLKDIVVEFFGIETPNTSVWERKRDNLLKEVKKILDTGIPEVVEESKQLKQTGILSDNYYDNQNEKIKKLSIIEWPKDFEMQLDYIRRQTKAIEKLKSHKPIDISREDFKSIRNNGRNEWSDDFEMQLDFEQRQVESLRRLNEI